MTFICPIMLVALVFIPPLIGVYVSLQQRRKRLIAQYGGAAIVQGTTAPVQGSARGIRRHIPAALFLVALTILIVALARPQTTVSLPKMEGIVVLAFDVSGSMAADDMK